MHQKNYFLISVWNFHGHALINHQNELVDAKDVNM